MAKLAFVGLGLMGTPMATRLLEAGNDLTVWNRTAEKSRPLADRGAAVASTPAEAAVGVEAAITMVANPQALEQVVFGTDGLAAALRPGQLLIDMSTVGPETVREVAARLPQGVTLVDAPVRGSVPEATAGRLAIYVGADQAVFDRVAPILTVLGTPHRVGGPGAGAAAKVDRKSTRLNSSHGSISYAVFCLKKKKKYQCLVLLVYTQLADSFLVVCFCIS